MNGTDDADNLVLLTAEEHFVAHQLLVKIYPSHRGIWSAAYIMCVHQNKKRITNKRYGWLKRGFAIERSRIMQQNGGPTKDKKWIVCVETNEVSLICKNKTIPEGWMYGKVVVTATKKKSDKKKERTKKAVADRTEFMKNEAIELFNKFKNGNFKSVREFARSDKSPYSHVYILSLWRRWISGFENKVNAGRPCVPEVFL